MNFRYNDGGRQAAGYKGKANDCVARAVAIILDKPYIAAYAELNSLCSKKKNAGARTGIPKTITRTYLQSLGLKWTPTMQIGSGCRVHLTPSELPTGRIIVSVSGHICAVIDGELHDTHDCTRAGKRCVYGYWTK